jgi:hypothetical protein
MPTIPSIILKNQNLNLEVSPSLSDVGLCTTLNGNSIEDTFSDSNNKMKNFKEMLGSTVRGKFKPILISGSGNIHHKKIWLNVRDVTGMVNTRGIMRVSINGWRDFISVRKMNNHIFQLL